MHNHDHPLHQWPIEFDQADPLSGIILPPQDPEQELDHPKEPVPVSKRERVAHSIPCTECFHTYIDQTEVTVHTPTGALSSPQEGPRPSSPF